MEVPLLTNTKLDDLIDNISNGADNKVITALNNEPNIIQENMTTLAKAAVEVNSKDILVTLIEHGLKVTEALDIIVTRGKEGLMDLVLDEVTDKKTQKYVLNECVYFAVKANQKDIITNLLKRGANINTNQREKNTPLHFAITEICEAGLLEHLIKNGADIKIPNKKRKTALDLVNTFLDRSQNDAEGKEKLEKLKQLLVDKDYECLTGGPSVLIGFSYQIKYLTLYAIINTKLAISQNCQYELSTEAKNLVPFDDIHLRRTQEGQTRCEFVQVKLGNVEQSKFFSMLKNDKNIKEYIKGNDSIVKMFIKFNTILDSPAYKNTTTEFIYCMNGKFQNESSPCFKHISVVDDLLCGLKRDTWIIDPKYLFIEIKYIMLNLIANSLYLTIMTDEFKNALNEQIQILDNMIKLPIIQIDNKHLWSIKIIAETGLIVIQEHLEKCVTKNRATDTKEVETNFLHISKFKSTKDIFKKKIPMETKELDEGYSDKDIFIFFSKYNECQIKNKIDNFVKHFRVFTNCPNSNELDKIIEQEIKEEFKVEIPKLITTFCLQYVSEWISNFNKGKLELFQDSSGKKLFNNIRIQIFNAFNQTYIEELQRGNIRFEQTNEEVKDFLNSQNKILHLITRNTRLHTIHIMQTLKSLNNLDERSIFYANLGYILKSVDNYLNFFCYFTSNDSNDLLILECADYNGHIHNIHFILNCLKNMITSNARKKIIIIAGNEDEVIVGVKCMTDDHISYNRTLAFKDLTVESQEIILNQTINFHNNPNSLKTVPKIRDFLTISTACNVIDEHMLLNIVTNNNNGIQIGNDRAFVSDEYNFDLYIPRHVVNDNATIGNINELVPQNIKDKIVIVANNAGEGKSTMLTHLAHCMRNKSENSWIIRIDLRNYTNNKVPNCLNSITYNVDDTTEAIEHIARMVIETNSTDTNNTFESILLQQILNECNRIRVILLFDGFDEISPNYKEKTCIMLKSLSKSKVQQLWLTTRVHLKEYLEKQLQVKAHTLAGLTETEQVQFLCKFWKFHLKINKYIQKVEKDENNLDLFEQRKVLMDNIKYITGHDPIENTDKNVQMNLLQIQTVIDDEIILQDLAEGFLMLWKKSMRNDDFLKIPLHLEMLAKNLMQREWKLNRSKILQLFEIYTEFIDNKLEIYHERGTTRRGNQHAMDQADITTVLFRKMHREIAVRNLFEHSLDSAGRKIVLPDLNICSEHSNYLEMLIRAGLVKIYGTNVEFIHRTFAEYFLSEYLVTHLEHPDVQSTFLKNILLDHDFQLVRKFFDRFLFQRRLLLQFENDQRENILVENVTKAIMKYNKYNLRIYENVLHIAVDEGHVEIFLLIFKNITKKAFVKLIMQNNFGKYSMLQLCVDTGNVDMVRTLIESIKTLKIPILESFIKRPFHKFIRTSSSHLVNYSKCSVLRDQLMMCHLHEQTVLHKLVMNGWCNILEIIINAAKSCSVLEKLFTKKDECGKTALHYATQNNNLDVLRIILKSIEENSEIHKDIILQTDNDGLNALSIAISNNDLVVCELILKTAEKYEQVFKNLLMKRDIYGRTPLYIAAINKSSVICDLILKSALNRTEPFKQIMMIPDIYGDIVLEKAIAINDYITCSILFKYAITDEEMFRELVMQCDNRFGMTALHIAASYGHLDMCCVILNSAIVHENVLKSLIKQQNLRKALEMYNRHRIFKNQPRASSLAKYKDCRDLGDVFIATILQSHRALRIWLFRFKLRVKVVYKRIETKKCEYSRGYRHRRILRIRFYTTVLCRRIRIYSCISRVNEFIRKTNLEVISLEV